LGQETIKFTKEVNQKIHEGVCYKLNPENDTLKIEYPGNFKYTSEMIKNASALINKYGENRLERRSAHYFTLAVFSPILITLICSFLWENNGLTCGFFLALFVFLIFYSKHENLSNTLDYYRDAKCKKCGKYFALQEYRKPGIEEISTNDNYTVTVIRHWKCKYCDKEDIRKGPENFRTYKGRIYKIPHKKCENCGMKYAVFEYQSPDIKEIGDDRTTMKHYKCEYCGYREIKIEKQSISPD